MDTSGKDVRNVESVVEIFKHPQEYYLNTFAWPDERFYERGFYWWRGSKRRAARAVCHCRQGAASGGEALAASERSVF